MAIAAAARPRDRARVLPPAPWPPCDDRAALTAHSRLTAHSSRKQGSSPTESGPRPGVSRLAGRRPARRSPRTGWSPEGRDIACRPLGEGAGRAAEATRAETALTHEALLEARRA